MRFPVLSPLFCLLPLAGYWLVLIYYLGAQWSVYDQYNYGWAVPVLCGYLLWRNARRGPQGASPLRLARGEGQGEVSNPCLPHFASRWALGALALCALLYAPTRFLHEANPTWRLTSWLWALEVVALTLLLLRTTDYGPRATDHPSRFALQVSRFTFPICFFLVAVPWPSGLENFLTQSLMRLNTTTTVELLGLFGVPAVQHGNSIEIGSGMVGIDEACSGIRSLQATLMISLFLGELYSLSAKRRALCVLAGFALAFLFNVGRTLLLTRVAAAKGVAAVAAWHDPAGVTILVGCFLCLWLIALSARRQAPSAERPAPCASRLAPLSVSTFQRFSIFLAAWLLVVEAGTEIWYRSHEQAAVAGVEWSVKRPAQGSSYHEVEMPPSIRGQFNADEGIHTRWQDGSGSSWQLYYFRWTPAHSLKQRVAIQLAKTHGPEKCLPAVGMSLKASLGTITVPVAGMELAMQQYVFNAEGTLVHVFYGIYEDPTGSAQLANRRKNSASRVAAALAGSRHYGQRFFEVAVLGYERPEVARAALVQELEQILSVGK
jgi:exosortase/archaeosortase family protein